MYKYKPRDKFILEIEKVLGRGNKSTLYLIKGFRSLVMDDNGLDRLERYHDAYTKQELIDAVDKAYKRGFDEGRTRGLNDGYEKASAELAKADAEGKGEDIEQTLIHH